MKHLKIFLLLLATLGSTHLYAKLQGQAKIDSLLKELPKQKEDTNKVNILHDLSYGYSSVNPDEGIRYGQMGVDLATKLGWKKGIARVHSDMAASCLAKSEYEVALNHCLKALKLDEEMGDKKGIASTTGNIGNIYNSESNYPKALEYLFRALKAHKEIENKSGIAGTSCNIGMIYGKQGDFPKALEYLSKGQKQYEELGNKQGLAVTTSNIGLVYLNQGDIPKALECFLLALKLNEELGDKWSTASTTLNIGIAYRTQKNYTVAIDYYRKSVKIAEELGDKYNVAMSLDNIGGTFLDIIGDSSVKTNGMISTAEKGQHAYEPTGTIPKGKAALLRGSIDHLERALRIAKEIDAQDIMQACYTLLAKAYKLNGEYKKALDAADNMHAIQDSVFSKENREKILKMGLNDEYERQHLADSLKTAEKEKIAAINLQKQKTYTYLGIAGILLLAGFSFFIMKERSKSENERKKSDGLLLNILPTEVAEELKTTGTTSAKYYDNVTVLFTDFVNFTEAGERMSAQGLIDELHTCFKMFDEITHKYNIEKIKTIGDAYLAVCGLPSPDPKHAENVVHAAVEINAFMQDRLAKMGSERTFAVRIGIHSGSVVAGIVGVKKFAYDIWGDTVNTAARMEQNSVAGKINISETTYELVKDKFSCEYRGEVEAKGKGVMKMYFVS